VIEQRLADVTARIEEFQQFRRVLEEFVRICRRTGDDDSCEVIERI